MEGAFQSQAEPKAGPGCRSPLPAAARTGSKPSVVEDGFAAANNPLFLYCRTCRQLITSSSWRLQMAGSHLHTFPNPTGIVFQIGCFRAASGCRCHGAHTSEFSWFPGYTWCFALCAGCSSHLGWYYRAQAGNGFFGLITDRLAEGPPSG